MIYTGLTDSIQLPKEAKNGDLAYVNDGMYPRHYVWMNGCWHHERKYVCPVNASDLHHEPNA